MGSYLWSWQRAHSNVSPIQARPTVRTRSATYSTRYSSSMIPPSELITWLRPKPVAMRWSSVGGRQQIARQLLGQEAVVGHVGVEALNHPIAPAPHGPRGIVVEAMRVGVARHIEPVDRHALAVARRSEQAVDGGGIGRFAARLRSFKNASSSAGEGGRPIRSSETRRSQVSAAAGGLGVRPSASRRLRTKASIGFLTQRLVGNLGHGRPRGRDKRPVLGVLAAFFDPAFQNCDLLRGKAAIRVCGRHSKRRVLRHVIRR